MREGNVFRCICPSVHRVGEGKGISCPGLVGVGQVTCQGTHSPDHTYPVGGEGGSRWVDHVVKVPTPTLDQTSTWGRGGSHLVRVPTPSAARFGLAQ